MDEARLAPRRVPVIDACMVGGHLDVVAEHIVVPDLQRADAGLLDQVALHAGDDPARLVAQRPHLVELGVVARAHEAAVALQQRQFVGERRVEMRGEVARQRARAPRSAAASSGGQRRARQAARAIVARGVEARRAARRDRAGRRG